MFFSSVTLCPSERSEEPDQKAQLNTDFIFNTVMRGPMDFLIRRAAFGRWERSWIGPYRRVLRGGSWNNNARNCRAANRNRNEPGNRNNNIGFRLCFRLHFPSPSKGGPGARRSTDRRGVGWDSPGLVPESSRMEGGRPNDRPAGRVW